MVGSRVFAVFVVYSRFLEDFSWFSRSVQEGTTIPELVPAGLFRTTIILGLDIGLVSYYQKP